MAIPDLMGIAQELGIAVSQDDPIETVVYAILDKAAENSAATEAPKRKRTRIQKKDTSRVYTVNGKDGENFDVKNNRKPAEAPSLFSDMPEATAQEAAQNNAEEKPAEPKPKKRGRKSKATAARRLTMRKYGRETRATAPTSSPCSTSPSKTRRPCPPSTCSTAQWHSSRQKPRNYPNTAENAKHSLISRTSSQATACWSF